MMESQLKADVENLSKFKVFDLSWDITKNEVNAINNQARIRRKTERKEIRNFEKKQSLLHTQQANSRFIEFEEPEDAKTKGDFHKKSPVVQKEAAKTTS